MADHGEGTFKLDVDYARLSIADGATYYEALNGELASWLAERWQPAGP